jgi:hypothetical protein
MSPITALLSAHDERLRGKGAALKTGFEILNGDAVIVTILIND